MQNINNNDTVITWRLDRCQLHCGCEYWAIPPCTDMTSPIPALWVWILSHPSMYRHDISHTSTVGVNIEPSLPATHHIIHTSTDGFSLQVASEWAFGAGVRFYAIRVWSTRLIREASSGDISALFPSGYLKPSRGKSCLILATAFISPDEQSYFIRC